MNYLRKIDKTFIILNIAFWVLLSFLTTIKAGLFTSSQEVYWAHIFSYTFTSCLLWILFTFFIWWFANQHTLTKNNLFRLIVFHLLLVPIGSALQRYLSMSLDYFIQKKIMLIHEFPPFSEYLEAHFPRRWVEGMLWYIMITVSVYVYIQLKKGLKKTEIGSSGKILEIKKKGTMVMVRHNDILFVESKSNYCFIHTKLDVLKMRSSLKALEQNLMESGIVRIHNSFLINPALISGYRHIQNGEYSFSLFNIDRSIFSSKLYRNQAKNIIDSFKEKK